MAKQNQNFNIPVPLIVLAYIVYWPVGVVLTVLRCISKPTKTDEKPKNPNWTEMPYDTAAARDYKASDENIVSGKKTKAKSKTPASVKLLNVLGVLSGLIGVFVAYGEALFYSTGFWDFMLRLLVYCIPAALISGSCLLSAKMIKDREIRISRIRAMIGNKKSLNLNRLASAAGNSLKRTRKDVQYMIDRGDFGDSAYIDMGTNNFMRYIDAEPDTPEESSKIDTENTDSASDEDNFTAIIRQIRRLNDEIEDKVISDKIDMIESHTRNVFDYVTDHPEAMPQIRSFLNYYLPTTLKLLESYSRIERVGVAGENMKKSKENIERIMDLLVVGFEQQVDQLFRNESIDISSDIGVLERMMAMDGLDGRNDFQIKPDAPEFSDDISDISGGAAAQSSDFQ